METFKIIRYLSEGKDTFLSPNDAAFHHDKVISHFAIMREASLQGQSQRSKKVRIKK